jgi:hypothetical protein
MPFLSFDKSKDAQPVAVVRGGDLDGNILYVSTGSSKSSSNKEVQAHKYMKDLTFVKPQERIRLMNQIVEGIQKDLDADAIIGLPSQAKDIYKRIKTETANDKTIRIPDDSTFQPIPNPDPSKRQIWYVAGASGSGKSFFAKGISENYKKLFPEREIYLISKLTSDATLDSMKIGKPKRIDIETLLSDPFDLEECKDCLIICDDFDCLDKPLLEAVHKLIDDVCTLGRHEQCSLMIISHHLSNYKKTRLSLNESHFLVLYPLATSHKALKYVSEMYGNCDTKEIANFKNRGRWVCIHKQYPTYIISEHEANMPNA